MYAVNDEDFRNAQKDFASFVEKLSELVTEKDYTVPELPNKDIVCLGLCAPPDMRVLTYMH